MTTAASTPALPSDTWARTAPVGEIERWLMAEVRPRPIGEAIETWALKCLGVLEQRGWKQSQRMRGRWLVAPDEPQELVLSNTSYASAEWAYVDLPTPISAHFAECLIRAVSLAVLAERRAG